MKRNELKVIIAIILVMATLCTLASLVSAGFVEVILSQEIIIKGNGVEVTASSSSDNHKLPTIGPANGSLTRYGVNGEVLQVRYYDSDGRAYKDTDYWNCGDPINHPVPHDHYWTWDENGKCNRGGAVNCG